LAQISEVAMLYFLIVNYRSARLVAQAIASIQTAIAAIAPAPPVTIVVVNNSPEDPDLGRLDRQNLVWIESGQNLGFGAACNLALTWIWQGDRAATVWLLNPDAELDPTAIAQWHTWQRQHSPVAIVGTAVSEPDGTTWLGGTFDPHTGEILPRVIGARSSSANLSQTNLSQANLSPGDPGQANLSQTNLSQANLSQANLSPRDPGQADLDPAKLSQTNPGHADPAKTDTEAKSDHPPVESHPGTDWVSGCSLILNLAAFPDCPQFDPAFFLYYEDFDLCRRAVAQGLAIALAPAIRVYHRPSSITGRDPERHRLWSVHSYLLALAKHAPRRVWLARLGRMILSTVAEVPRAPRLARVKAQAIARHLLDRPVAGSPKP
jgi:GT2 family glycosyltransferase